MQIGEISKRTGFSKDTIRWYEKIGLIVLDIKTRTKNNYRYYNENTLQRLLRIKELKAFGFTLKEIEELLYMEEVNTLNCTSVSALITKKLHTLDTKIKELQHLRRKLSTTKARCNTGKCDAATM